MPIARGAHVQRRRVSQGVAPGGTGAIGRLTDAAAIVRGEAGTVVTPSGTYLGADSLPSPVDATRTLRHLP